MSRKAQKLIKAAAAAAAKLLRENESSSSGDDTISDSNESPDDNLTADPSFVCDVNLSDNTTDRETRAALRVKLGLK